jgi:hypothetical protein
MRAPVPVARFTGVLRAGPFVLYQPEGPRRLTVLAIADAPGNHFDPVEFERYAAPDLADGRTTWFEGGHGGECVPCAIREVAEPDDEEAAERLRRLQASRIWPTKLAHLERAARGARRNVSLKSGGRVVIECQCDGVDLPSDREIASRASVDVHRVPYFLRTLGRLDPKLFEKQVLARERVLRRSFATNAAAWKAEIDELETHFYTRQEFCLALELRAWRFSPPKRQWPSAAQLALKSGLSAGVVTANLDEALKNEMEAALMAEFGDRPGRWDHPFVLLRQGFSGLDFVVAGWTIIWLLRGQDATIEQVSAETGISRDTVSRHRQAAKDLIVNFFPSFGRRRGRGRPMG